MRRAAKNIAFYVVSALAIAALVSCGNSSSKQADNKAAVITVSGAFALYPMMVKWGEEYHKLHANIRIDISAGGAGKGMADTLGKLVDIGMISRDVHSQELDAGAFPVAVARDAVVGIVSADNPALALIQSHGITKDQARQVWITGKFTKWNQLYPQAGAEAIDVYTRSDAAGAADVWSLYMGGKQEDLKGTGVFGDPGIVDAVKGDRLGIGYGNVNFVYDSSTKKPATGVAVVPLDKNGDGTISSDESFYTTRDDLVRAISTGAYPAPPSRKLYLVTLGKPARPEVAAFLTWILGDGQKYLPETGYINLPDSDIKAQIQSLK